MEQELDPTSRVLVTIAVLLAVFVQVLDQTIANVALPHIQASLGATPESVNWVLTSYIVAAAVTIPVSGWLADCIGRKPLNLLAVAGFTIASVLCAAATNLPQMLAFRVLQGMCGAFLIPLAQATLFDINPPERHGQAMALFGGGVMIGPILGPVLGGWLTDSFNWRWVFLVNLPIGTVAFTMLWRYLPATARNPRKFDLLGFALLSIALASLQILFDRGQQLDWFESAEIWIEAGIALSSFWMFFVHTITWPNALFEKSMYADRNFVTGMAFMAVTGVLMLAGLALLPPLLQRIYGYSVLESGILTAPRGGGTLISMLITGRLVGKIDMRILIAVGMGLMGWSMFLMTRFAIDMGSDPLIFSGLVQGLGLGLVMVPLQSVSFTTLPPRLRTTAASLLNLSRNIGGSIGISFVASLLARNIQTAHADLSTHVTDQALSAPAATLIVGPSASAQSALAVIDAEVNRQAAFIAYIDDFWIMMWLIILAIPLVLLLRPAQSGPNR